MGILLTMTQHTKVSEHYAADVRARYGNKLRVFDTEIPYNVKVQDNQSYVPFEWLDGVGLHVEVRYAGVTAETGTRLYKMPLVTVRTAEADAVAGRLTADAALKGYETSAIQREIIEENGVSLTRFFVTCRRKRGLAVIIR